MTRFAPSTPAVRRARDDSRPLNPEQRPTPSVVGAWDDDARGRDTRPPAEAAEQLAPSPADLSAEELAHRLTMELMSGAAGRAAVSPEQEAHPLLQRSGGAQLLGLEPCPLRSAPPAPAHVRALNRIRWALRDAPLNFVFGVAAGIALLALLFAYLPDHALIAPMTTAATALGVWVGAAVGALTGPVTAALFTPPYLAQTLFAVGVGGAHLAARFRATLQLSRKRAPETTGNLLNLFFLLFAVLLGAVVYRLLTSGEFDLHSPTTQEDWGRVTAVVLIAGLVIVRPILLLWSWNRSYRYGLAAALIAALLLWLVAGLAALTL